MSKIDFFALGGLDEHGKDCYVLTINGDIYILCCGISIPPNTTLGVKKIIPDFSWVIENKHAIKGVFIGTPSYDRYGALEFLVNHIPNIPIYTSIVGETIISTFFQKRVKGNNAIVRLNIRKMIPLKSENIGTCIITPFRIFNSIPYSLGFVFRTPDGSIIYIDDFIISSDRNSFFEDDLFEVNNLTNNKNLALIVGSKVSIKSKGFTNPNHRVSNYFEKIIANAPGRVIVSCYDHDVYKVIALIKCATNNNRQINIYSTTFVELFKMLVNKENSAIKNIQLLKDEDINTSKDGIIIVTGTPQRLFPKLEKIIDDNDTKFLLQYTDSFIFAENTIPGYEKLESDLFNNLAKTNIAQIYKLPSSILSINASCEDHKFLLKMLKPNYVIPVSGMYMNFIEYQKCITQTGFNKNNVVILENGKCAHFDNGKMELKPKFVQLQEQYIDAQGVLDVGASSMFERDQMKDNGVVLLSILFSREEKMIKKHNYDTIGVININTEQNAPIFELIKTECNKQITSLISTAIDKNDVNLKEIRNDIRKIVDKQFEKKFNKKPLVLTTIIFTKRQ